MCKNLTAFLQQYAQKHQFRGHMPGHKGKSFSPELETAYTFDITEIHGADSLFEANGILQQAERKTAEVYGVGGTCWSAGGSTLCIQAMLARMKAEHRIIIAPRTVHRAFLNSCILLDLPVKWIYPESGGFLDGKYTLTAFEQALQEVNFPACVYLTSPDYSGNVQNIQEISALCRKYQAKLLVDNAHGAHRAFLPENQHPIILGADYCCDSAHKTLPALTGGAFLHMRNSSEKIFFKQNMQLFGSTSPSYLIMQSLEECTEWLMHSGKKAISECAQRAERLKQKFSGKYIFLGNDPMHFTIQANGENLAEQMRNLAVPIECEYADKSRFVILLSPVMTEKDFSQLEKALFACEPLPAETPPECPSPMEQSLSLREAGLAEFEILPLSEAENRICAAVQVPCPPAVPIAVSGEKLSPECLAVMEFYGVQTVAVVKESI